MNGVPVSIAPTILIADYLEAAEIALEALTECYHRSAVRKKRGSNSYDKDICKISEYIEKLKSLQKVSENS